MKSLKNRWHDLRHVHFWASKPDVGDMLLVTKRRSGEVVAISFLTPPVEGRQEVYTVPPLCYDTVVTLGDTSSITRYLADHHLGTIPLEQ